MKVHIQQRKRPVVRAFAGLAGRPLDGPAPDPFADRDEYATELAAPLKFTDKAEKIRKDKEAERGRERRKLRREQLTAVKKAFTVEGREVLLRKKELERALKSESSDMAQGTFITDAPTGVGKLVYSGNIERIGAAADRAVALGGETYDPRTGEVYWPDHDRRHVKPEGTGQRNGQRSFEDAGTVRSSFESGARQADSTISEGRNKNIASGVPIATSRFIVKPGTDLDRGQAVLNVFHRLNEGGVCRLCYQECSEEHVEAVHGSEDEPRHDRRFGDVITPEVRKVKAARLC
jgi:hypothetical protein